MPTYPTSEVSYGQTSSDVKTLQNFLISQGYSIPDGATGYFGNETKTALSQWQSANGISSSTAGYGTNWGPLSQAAAQKSTASSQNQSSSQNIFNTTQPYSTGGTPAAPVASPGGGYTYNNQSYAAGTGPYATQFPAPKQTTTSTNQNNQTSSSQTSQSGQSTQNQNNNTNNTNTQNQQTTTTTTTPTTTTPTSFSAVTGENMVDGVYSTGNAQLDSILLGAQSALNTMIAGGQVINPSIALSPNDITIFLNQAKSIVDPDFANQISQVQQVLSQNLTQLQTQYENEQQYDNQQFQASLSQSREASVGAGYGGSARTMSDLLQTQEEQQSLNTLQNQTQSSAQNLVNTAAQSIGSSNVNTLPFNTYTATNQGLGGVNQSGQLSYAPINVTQGSLEAQQQTAESTQATQLASQALKNRSLNLYPTT